MSGTDARIVELASRIAARLPTTEAQAWEFAAEEFEGVVGEPLAKASAYHAALAAAAVGSGKVWSLLHSGQ